MSIFASWLLIASINLAATMSPGPAFAMTVRNSVAYGRRSAIITAIGLGVGIAVPVVLVLGGFMVLVAKSQIIFNILRYAGGAYLFYIGAKALLAKKSAPSENDEIIVPKNISDLAAFRTGLFTNTLNPKAYVFFMAFYSQFVGPQTPWQVTVLYALTAIIIEGAWFSLVAIFLTDPRIKRGFTRFSHIIERLCGGLLMALGIRLILE